MTWNTPLARNPGDLITAPIWNQDVVDNTQYLHDRVVERWLISSRNSELLGAMPVRTLDATNEFTTFSTSLPADFDQLVAADLILTATTGSTVYVDVTVNYGAVGQAYNIHSSSVTNQPAFLVSANQLVSYDLSGMLGSLSANDILGCRVERGSSSTADPVVVGVRLRYTRS